MITIRRLTGQDPSSHTELSADLCALLIDSVHGGASVGFLAPLSQAAAERYWEGVLQSLGDTLMLWVAEHQGRVVGSVQLGLCDKQNGRHRAEVQKLFVLTARRGQGIANMLMRELEVFARAARRSLLVLDTQAGSGAETVYRKLGWQRAGEIPNYAASPDGTLQGTAYYFKPLAP